MDVYLKGCCSRIAPEASVPLIDLLSRTACLGGAGNVAANLNAKRSKVLFCRVVGEDEGVHIAKEMLRSQEISDQLVVIDSGRKTLIKTRVSSCPKPWYVLTKEQ